MNTSENLHIISFSGGKDSVATWLHLTRELGISNVVCVFADTSHESTITYEYLDYLESIGCPLRRIHAVYRDLRKSWPEGTDEAWLNSQLTMEGLAAHKKRFPSATRRFCTTFLKLAPLKRFVDSVRDQNPMMVSGVRAEESRKRAMMDPQPMMDDYMGILRWLPIHGWTATEVFDCHKRHGIEPNPLYKQGMGRVGCFPCIMARKSEIRAIAERFPEALDRLAAMEKRVGYTFFGPDMAPKTYRSQKDKGGKRFSTADDIRNWALGLGPQGQDHPDFIDEGDDPEAEACSSIYGLCE